jgi:flagellar biosynthetic protein FlhB
MAEGEDRTEAATPRRLARAREAGLVPLSREAAPAAVLATVTLLLVVLAPAAARRLAERLALLLAGAHALSPAAGVRVAALAGLFAAAPFVLAAALATIGAVLGQTGGLVHPGALVPDLSHLSPRRGLARIFSAAGLLEAGKALAKVAAAGAAVWVVLAGALPLLPAALAWTAPTLLAHTMGEALRVLMVVIAVQAAIAGFDIVRTRCARSTKRPRAIRRSRRASAGCAWRACAGGCSPRCRRRRWW